MPRAPRTGRHIPRAARLCKVLSHDSRRRILIEMAAGPLNVGAIAKGASMTMANASKALALLYDHDLVEVLADGNQRFYSLTKSVRVKRTSDHDELTIRSSDGSSLTLRVKVRR